jgi:steroid delta-isomerase-like uncharacterized protein
MNTPKEVLLKWVEAMNTRNIELGASIYHEDAINHQIATGAPLVGIRAIRKDLADFFNNIPDNFTKVENLFEDGEWAIIEWSGGGTFQPTGQKFTLRGCGFFHVVNGKIKLQRGYYDKHTWFSQVGLETE